MSYLEAYLDRIRKKGNPSLSDAIKRFPLQTMLLVCWSVMFKAEKQVTCLV